jgi:hypothetical protein
MDLELVLRDTLSSLQTLPVWVGVLLGLVLMFWIVTADYVRGRLPPRFHVVWRMLTGGFTLQADGPLAIVQAGYDKFGDIFRIKLGHRGLTFVVGPANHVFFASPDTDVSQREVYHFTVPVFGKDIVYDAHPKVMVQQVRVCVFRVVLCLCMRASHTHCSGACVRCGLTLLSPGRRLSIHAAAAARCWLYVGVLGTRLRVCVVVS